MKPVLAISLCLFFCFDAFAQTEKTAEAGVEEITLARSDGNGGVGETTDKFIATDIPIYCLITLDSTKSVAVKMNLIAVKAAGLKPETKVVVVNYKMNGKQNQVNFDASPGGVWAAGSYRVDIYIDGKLAKSRAFEIEKSPAAIKKEKKTPVKSLAPRKRLKKSRKS